MSDPSSFDWDKILNTVMGVGGYVFTRALAVYKTIQKEWMAMKKEFTLLKNSLEKNWQETDKLKERVTTLEEKLLSLESKEDI